MLNNASLIIATIYTCLANPLHLKNALDLDTINLAGDGDALESNADEELADEMEPPINVQLQKYHGVLTSTFPPPITNHHVCALLSGPILSNCGTFYIPSKSDSSEY